MDGLEKNGHGNDVKVNRRLQGEIFFGFLPSHLHTISDPERCWKKQDFSLKGY